MLCKQGCRTLAYSVPGVKWSILDLVFLKTPELSYFCTWNLVPRAVSTTQLINRAIFVVKGTQGWHFFTVGKLNLEKLPVMMFSTIPCTMKQMARHPFPDEHRLWRVFHATYLRQALLIQICLELLHMALTNQPCSPTSAHSFADAWYACQTTLSSNTCNLGCSLLSVYSDTYVSQKSALYALPFEVPYFSRIEAGLLFPSRHFWPGL